MKPELHRPLRLDRVRADVSEHDIVASAEECRALAERLGLPAILSLACGFRLRRLPKGVVSASGRLAARVVRTCVVTLEEFETDVAEDFVLRFVPEGTESAEVDPELEDEIAYPDDVIDLGEAAAEELALALDPYPRRPGAELAIETEEQPAHPFAGLEGLRRRH